MDEEEDDGMVVLDMYVETVESITSMEVRVVVTEASEGEGEATAAKALASLPSEAEVALIPVVSTGLEIDLALELLTADGAFGAYATAAQIPRSVSLVLQFTRHAPPTPVHAVPLKRPY